MYFLTTDTIKNSYMIVFYLHFHISFNGFIILCQLIFKYNFQILQSQSDHTLISYESKY